jgi:hypothetical protein
MRGFSAGDTLRDTVLGGFELPLAEILSTG